MSKKDITASDTKLACNILQNKLKNLKEYDTRFGTNIIQSLSKNISSVDDVLMKQLGTVDMIGCGNNKYLSNEAESVTNIYTDLLTKIANSQVGCGGHDDGDTNSTDRATVNKFKNNFITLISKDAKRGRKGGASKRSGSKRRGSKRKSKKSTSPMLHHTGDGPITTPSITMDVKKRRKRTGSKKSGSKKRSGSKSLKKNQIIF